MEYKELIEKGIHLAKNGRFEEAMELLEEDLCFAQHPVAMSYYAVCMAELEGSYDKAISLCLSAAQSESCNPNIYFNLGRIILHTGQKAFALKAFKKGLKYDGNHSELLNEIKKLGIRHKPVISFLPRHNFINRFLGKFTYRLKHKTAKILLMRLT
ncbi:MAG: hypothetical protein HZB54_05525 [Deltaproteobacteria bacterium]|nr:hypothetical protein [Deltaproteobacteria bacterium]